MNKNIACIILAAGKGERMKSETPKVLHTICGRPMINYVLDLVDELKISNSVVVLGHKHEEVKKAIGSRVRTVIQKKLVGTADAVKQALSALSSFKGTVLILYGDIPLLKKDTIRKLIDSHTKNKSDLTVLTAEVDKPSGYGRIKRDKFVSICGIVEEKDANEYEKLIKEINTGIICFDKNKLAQVIKQIKPNNRKKEYYLTDAIKIFYDKGYFVEGVKIADVEEAMGANSRVDLAKAAKVMQGRINLELMNSGVTIIDPSTAIINFGTKIGKDTIIYPFTVVDNSVKIGKHCFIGPFAHLRDGTTICDNVVVGNFLEIVRSKISSETFVKHFSYIGDSNVGRGVNIGAGTVTANFDGKNKHNTVIKDGAFIGSDSVLIAPVKVGRRAVVAAGSVVLRNTFVRDGKAVAGVPAKLIKRH